ncbi:barstar family protein [Brevundimonas subvibrioides]|uniref:Barstar (Barnase inhibitor) n=1 Tax=Brevundimonas subvibrioides (strain ATCC 15264 / DSM 4735 / LMG 14903 / NBRC 16000 / CB 81) TaxID=633149 RepID=D9QMC1_BRESC|nr:barstar family protein [Brevundimonas subvibrioides]ADL02047.1 Barstar (barnase inhibitor) [Brevundimonas subvibrioides ATCC 15264]
MSETTHRVRIDGRSILTRADFYAAVESVEGTPDWMGRNLDALFDVLVALWPKPTVLEWTHAAFSARAIGPDFEIITGVLRDAQTEPCSRFTLRVFDGEADLQEQTQ